MMLWFSFYAACATNGQDSSQMDSAEPMSEPSLEPAQPASEPSLPSSEPSNEPDPSSFNSIEFLFTDYACTGCHGTSGGFTLSYDTMLNGTSGITNEPYIIPGNPDGSYIYKKITDAPGISGQPMPIGGSGGMDTEDRTLIRSWIELGANP